ncbi:hypothetical protein ACJ3XI_08555 [Litorimonas sp. RW-G-Af-16]|uniref:hypothetical protein n=1 Tax=Litorimonas sp. RW-G-Af-16 TaxID=3241168 RepID=UPI00390C8548
MTIYDNYNTPADIQNASNLSKDEKLEILEKWEADEMALIRAASEGLSGGEDNQLKQVRNAIAAVKEQD